MKGYGHKLLSKLDIKRLNRQYRHGMEIYLILENIQYARNVASIFRIADAVAVKKIFLTGITVTPPFGKDLVKVSRHKERSVQWEYRKNTGWVLNHFRKIEVPVIALEFTNLAEPLFEFEFPNRFALLVGNETYGITRKTLQKVYQAVFIPMFGKGASLNVHISVAVTLFWAALKRL